MQIPSRRYPLRQFLRQNRSDTAADERKRRNGATRVNKVLRSLRQSAGLTQPQLAQLANVSVRALRDIEQGRVARPHPGSLARIAEALKLSETNRSALLGIRQGPAERGSVTIGLLGPLLVSVDGVLVQVRSLAQQRLVSLLALEADRVVSRDEIVDLIWGTEPPDGWRNRIHVHIGQLRQIFHPAQQRRQVLRTEAGGYRFDLPVDSIDTSRFIDRIAQARRSGEAGDERAAMQRYQEALSCWRGRMLAGGDGSITARPAAQALHRERLAVTCEFANLAIKNGQHDQAVLWLQAVAEEEPLHEGLHSRLMMALAGAGQQDKALQHFRELRRRLAEELGIDPTAETQTAYRAILSMGVAAIPASRAALPRPAQLPMTSQVLAGRDAVVSTVLDHFTGATRAGEIPAPRVLVMHGMAGVGKTSAAIHVAHRIRQRYPDGQLFAELQGERGYPKPVDQILAGFLRSLGVPAARIPPALADRTALLRTSLAGRRVLMVLDDAKNADQVLPLLPSDAGNDVIITSRNPLIELPVTRYPLRPLGLTESLAVLTNLIPAEEVVLEPAQAAMIAAACAGLPLALRVAAARLITGADPDELARTLNTSRHKLNELHSGQLAVRSSLDSGFRALSVAAQTALRRMAALPTLDFPSWSIHAAMDVDADESEVILTELIRAHMIRPVGKNEQTNEHQHHRLHDLIRLYALDQTDSADLASVDNVVLNWLQLARSAQRSLRTEALAIEHLGLPVSKPPTSTVVDPLGWFDREHGHLIDLLRYAAAQGQPLLTAGLLNTLGSYLHARYLTDEWRQCIDLALACSQTAGDKLAEAYALESKVHMCLRTADVFAALPIAEQALLLFEQAGNRHGQAHMYWHLQFIKRRTGSTEGALNNAGTALRLFQDLGDAAGQAAVHQGLGVINREYLKNAERAEHHFKQALSFVTNDNISRLGKVCFSLAALYLDQDRFEEAEPLLLRGLEISRANNDTVGVSNVLNRLSDVLGAQGRYDEAGEILQKSLALATQAGQRDVLAQAHTALSRLAKRRGQVADGLRHLRQAAEVYQTMDAPQALAEIHAEIARLSSLAPGATP